MYILPLYLTLVSFLFSIILGKLIGIRGVCFLTVINVFFSMLISFFIFFEIIISGTTTIIDLCVWLSFDLFNLSYNLIFDQLTACMLMVVCTVSFCAHLYSVEYMNGDPHQARFMSYLSLFTFFMLVLITANNIIQLFIGWEGVGICSYLLINFWYTRIKANKAAIMAVIVNKIGDIALMISFGFIYLFCKSFNYFTIFGTSQIIMEYYHFGVFSNYVYYICILFIIGAIGKSAQLGLHMWLPEAMEGPTPVSSLIHAATMVTAGIFLVIRCSFLFELVPNSLLWIIFFGSLTTFFASTVGLFQNDLKKVVAYSTCSQLGYMFMSCGLSGYNFSLFHLFNHAFFKALLFLTAGYIIHALFNEQDIRQFGGLVKLLPFSYIMILVSSLSLAGFPFYSGFFSKEKILELYFNKYVNLMGTFNYYSFYTFFQFISNLAVIFTIFYSVRLIYLLYYGRFNGYSNYILVNNYSVYKYISTFSRWILKIHYGNWFLIFPLVILFCLTVVSGYLFKDALIGVGSNFWGSSLFMPLNELNTPNDIYFYPLVSYNTNFLSFLNFEFNFYMRNITLFWTFYFLFIFSILFFFFRNIFYFIKISQSWTYSLFLTVTEKYIYINKLIQLLNQYMLHIAYKHTYLLFDKGLLEHFGPYGIIKIISKGILLNNSVTRYNFFYLIFYFLVGILFFIHFL